MTEPQDEAFGSFGATPLCYWVTGPIDVQRRIARAAGREARTEGTEPRRIFSH